MRARYVQIYESEAERYEALISREDHQGQLSTLLSQYIQPKMIIAELGAGTGRLSRWLAPLVARLYAFDAAAPMLREARRHLKKQGRVSLSCADHRRLPLPSASVDLVIEGWAFGHLMDEGIQALEAAIKEARRIARRGAPLLLIETLGTGRESPKAPNEALTEMYRWLKAQDFEHQVCRTDYLFKSQEEGLELLSFFFGEAMAENFRLRAGLSFPECTGIWSERVAHSLSP